MTESELQTQVQDYLDLKGIYHRHIPKKIGKYRNQLSGIFDLICMIQRNVFFIELKNPAIKVKIRKSQITQKEFEQILIKNEIDYIISNNLEEIKTFVDGLINAMSNM